jgi:hypothetical protein
VRARQIERSWKVWKVFWKVWKVFWKVLSQFATMRQIEAMKRIMRFYWPFWALIRFKGWWAVRDSNSRQPGCKPGTLTN